MSEDQQMQNEIAYYKATKIIRDSKIKLVKSGVTHYDTCRIRYVHIDGFEKT